MFTCERCFKPTGPSISPIHVVLETRVREYTNKVLDPESDEFFKKYVEKVTSGSEIVLEEVICPSCAGIEVKPQAKQDLSFFRAAGLSAIKHTRSCNKHLEDCKMCQQIVRWFRGLPATVLSAITQNEKALEFTSNLAHVAFGSFCDRTHDESKRGRCDAAAAGALLKQFEQIGGRL